MFKQRKHYNKSPMRRRIPGVGAETYRGSRTPINITSTIAASMQITVTFDQAVIFSGILPKWEQVGGTFPTSVTQTSPSVWVVHYGVTVDNNVDVPFEDPAFRNSAGGYVTQQTFPFGD